MRERWRIIAIKGMGSKRYTVALVRQRSQPTLSRYASNARAMYKDAEGVALEREQFDAQGKRTTWEEIDALEF